MCTAYSIERVPFQKEFVPAEKKTYLQNKKYIIVEYKFINLFLKKLIFQTSFKEHALDL